MMDWKAKVRDERGAVLALVALSMVAILGFAALAVDVGHLLDARTQAQKTADAMALAAASAFIDDAVNIETIAGQRATEYAENNPVQGITASFDPATDMQIDLAARRVRVWAIFTQDRGNPMQTWFARVLGINSVNVVTMAAAEAARADQVGCLTPWALADMWVDTYTGKGAATGKFDYNDADKSNTPTAGDTFDNYCPCYTEPDGDIVADPNYQFNGIVCNAVDNQCTGFGSPMRDQGDVGRQLVLKPGNPAQAWSPGWFMAWRPPENMGGADYRQNIITCIDETMFDAGSIVPVDTEQGNMIGPTIQGVTERIGSDTYQWEPGCTDGKSCIQGPCGDGGTFAESCPDYNGPRIITVPLMDPSEVMRNGLAEIQFRGFMSLFLDTPSSNDITGHIIGVGGSAGSGGEDQGAGALPLVLRLVE